MKRKAVKTVSYPETDVVILAGGLARRMNGINKLLHKFDDEIQLIKIHQQLKSRASKVWVNSHRDRSGRSEYMTVLVLGSNTCLAR